MATLEQIIDEARKLPVEEQRRLRAALETLDSNGEAQPASQEPSRRIPESLHDSNGNEEVRQRRMEWLKSHREEYGGNTSRSMVINSLPLVQTTVSLERKRWQPASRTHSSPTCRSPTK
jgi:hypothetical protein